MKDGFIKVAAITPDVRVGDVCYNTQEILKNIKLAQEQDAKLMVFPELCITGYTCGDLFGQEILLKKSKDALLQIARETKKVDALIFVGLPFSWEGGLYNVAAALNRGKILGLTTKTYLPNYGEFYEMRQFTPGLKDTKKIILDGQKELGPVSLGPKILYKAEEMPELIVSAEICEDVWAPISPGMEAALAGAVIIANCSASSEIVGKDSYRRELIKGQSSKMMAGYIYANAGEGESTTDVVFGGHNLIVEKGSILAESKRFHNGIIISEMDVSRLQWERRKNTTFRKIDQEDFAVETFHLHMEETALTRHIPALPFVPSDLDKRSARCEEILMIQAMGLKKRLQHTKAERAVVGISGGLDSTLALLVTAKAFDLLGKDRKDILAITMPCFGTTDRTYQNACQLTTCIGAELREIPISEAVTVHFNNIGQGLDDHSVVFENAQARERTQVLMDVANMENGLVIGTGDMSELALGWATYNGDHMSMYGVNAAVPKTLVRYLVQYCAQTAEDERCKAILTDILDTPVSPELLPPKEGEITQKTEDLVGPYELHDFYLYYMMRFGYEPGKIYRIACKAFEGIYEKEVIMKWLKKFYWRFFSQQYKRSCLPDGPKIGSVSLSPRGDLRMPSDACAELWIARLEEIEAEEASDRTK